MNEEQKVQARLREELGLGVLASSKLPLVGSVRFVGDFNLNTYGEYCVSPSTYAWTYYAFKAVESEKRGGLAALVAELYDTQEKLKKFLDKPDDSQLESVNKTKKRAEYLGKRINRLLD